MHYFRYVVTAVMVLMLGGAATTVANAGHDKDKKRDHEIAAQALKRGEVLSLTKILSIVQSRIEGEIVEIEFERDDSQWIYEIKYITPQNKMMEMELDAKTGEVLKNEED